MEQTINETKLKIVKWLKEESFSPEEVKDPQTFFNIEIRIGQIGLNVVQDLQHKDSIFVGGRLTPPEDLITSFRNRTTPEIRRLFLLDLQIALLGNRTVSEFQFTIGSSPDEFQKILIVSKRVYYDDLTKSSLVSTATAIQKLILVIPVLMERYASASSSRTQVLPTKPLTALLMSE